MTDRTDQPTGIDDARLDTVTGGGILTALLLPAVQKVDHGTDGDDTRDTAAPMRCANNLRQIG